MFKNSKWIKSPENKEEACYEFYIEFNSKKAVKSAELNITAMGMYRAYINGQRVGDELFTPYWTEYSKRLQYQTYDVTSLINKNTEVCIICAEGWAVGDIRSGGSWRNHYADNISLKFVLNITYDDGTKAEIISDENIKVRTSEIMYSSIYNGETIDKTAEIRELGNALIDENVVTTIIPQQGEKVIEQDIIYPVKLIETPCGEMVIDFGQNLSGYVEVTARGHKGDTIKISHAEILDRDGNFYTANLRTAKQQNTYVLAGDGEETFKPVFTWQGFRYVRLDEYPFEEIDSNDFKAIVVYSDIKRTGDFVSGNQKINQLYHNIIWGQKGNFVDVPTDCPQRDERMGWTGDAQVFVRTAAINFDVEKFFTKWLADLAASQLDNGGIYWFVPTNNEQHKYPENVGAAWGDAATICPWEIYMAYGNKEILEKQYDSMKKWVDYIGNVTEEKFLWIGGKQFGDWLGMDNEDGSYQGATAKEYISSAFYAYSTFLFVKAGKVIGRDMSDYEELYENIVKTFKARFMKDGLPTSKTQTAYAIALYFNLCTDKEKTAKGLAELVKNNGNRLTTGFVGTPYLLHALSENGYSDVAFDLLMQEAFPSWLFSVNQGATTMWEHWDGVKEDGSFWEDRMNSFNHYAYGAVYDWIFGVAAGIKILEDGAGYKHVSIKPHTDKRLGFLKAGIETRYGRLSSYWYCKDNETYFEFEIPNGVTAEITLPDGKGMTLGGGNYTMSVQG